MKRFFKILSIMTVFSLLLFSLAFGGGEKKGATAPETIKLRVLSVYTPDHSVGPVVEKINKIYSESHPNVKIEMQTMAADQLRSILKNDFEAGNPPDVFNIWVEYTNLDYIKNGLWYNFKKALEEDPDWANNFNSGALKVHKYGTDGIWGIPQAAFGLGIYYNKEIFKKAGITKEPATMEEFYQVVDKLKKVEGIVPMPIGNLDLWRSNHLLDTLFYKLNGCEAARKLVHRELRYDGPEMLKAFEELERMAKSGALGPMYQGLGYSDEVSMFNEGKSAMRFSGSWTLGEIAKNIDAGFFPFPYYKDRPQYKDDWFAGYAEGWGMAAGLSPEKEKAALDYVKLWTSPKGFKLFAEVAKNIPAGKADIDPNVTGKLFAEFVSELSTAKDSLPDIPEPDSVVKNVKQTMAQAALALKVTPEEAVKKIQEAVESQEKKKK